MQNLFFDTYALDKNAIEKYSLSSTILMENAAKGMADFLSKKLKKESKILLLCGSGDNGADCLTLARILAKSFKIHIFMPFGAKSALCIERLKTCERLQKEGLLKIDSTIPFKKMDCIVDGIFGIGFKGEFSSELRDLITRINAAKSLKIACDIPSGINLEGKPRIFNEEYLAFKADFTLCMGALKVSLFSDLAKDFVGKVKLLDLGIHQKLFTQDSKIKLLKKSDFKAPMRSFKNTNKGSFGHTSIFCGEKSGASILSAKAALRSGSGLVTLISKTKANIPYEIMQNSEIPQNTTAILLGMGYGRENANTLEILKKFSKIPLLLDADIFYLAHFKTLLNTFENVILTPHPKEFLEILKGLNLCISLKELQENRIHFAQIFAKKYPHATLLLKGANTIIAQNDKIFINPLGSNILAKGGSGDVLAGMIGGYLAQGYSPLQSCIQGSLMHTICAKKLSKKHNNFSLSPLDLIKQIRYI